MIWLFLFLYFYCLMPAFYIILLIIGSMTLTRRLGKLSQAIKEKNKGKVKAEIFLLLLTVSLIISLIALHEWTK